MEKKRTEKGIEHGLMEEIANSVPDTGYKNLSEKNRKEMIERRKKDLELISGTYQNLKNQETGKWEGWYAEYPGVSMKNFRLLHGHTYTIPRGLAKKINNMKVPKRSGLTDGQGNILNIEGQFEQTHQFVGALD
jgi:hypothetical protein